MSDPVTQRPLAGVIGFPVAHSRSPQIQNAALRACGLDWLYVKLPVAAELFAPVVGALSGSGYRGANVTIPHKVSALECASRATEAALAVGAANSLTFEDGEIVADNTDAGGLLDALRPCSAHGRRCCVLGAGGAARAAVFALRSDGAGEVVVSNRTPERATALAREFGVQSRAGPGDCDLLVNATSVGLDPAVDARLCLDQLGLTEVAVPEVVVDLVYRDGETPVCAWAREAGATIVDGLEVLVGQGARSFESWTGVPAPREVMREAALAPA